MKIYAARLKALRKEKGLTQQDVADRLGVNKQTVSGYERGVRKPDFERLDALAELFDVSIAYLVGSQDERGEYPKHGDADVILETARPSSDLERDRARVLQAYIDATAEIQEAVRRVLGVDR